MREIMRVIVIDLLLVVVFIITHLHLSLVEAVNDLHECERSGGIECHIERDGLNYNVYSKGALNE